MSEILKEYICLSNSQRGNSLFGAAKIVTYSDVANRLLQGQV